LPATRMRDRSMARIADPAAATISVSGAIRQAAASQSIGEDETGRLVGAPIKSPKLLC
jgi:hypothetical protein